jgi:hypothetical protein
MLAILTEFVPATNTRSARIKAHTCNGHRLVMPFDYELGDVERHFSVAQALARDQLAHADASTMVYGGTAKGYVFCFPQSTVGA